VSSKKAVQRYETLNNMHFIQRNGSTSQTRRKQDLL